MSVAESARSVVTSGTASSASHVEVSSTITVGASDTFLLFAIEADTSTPGTPTATWDSGGTNQAMTLLGTITNSTSTPAMSLCLFGLVSPTVGAKKFAWTFPGQSSAVNSYHFAVSFTGTETSSVAAATTGFATNQAASGASATVSSGASIASGAMAVAAYNNINGYSNAFTAGTNPGDGGTAVGKNESLTTNMAGEYYSGGGGAVNASATQGASGAFVAAIVGILPPGGAGSTIIITPQLRTIIGRLKPQPFKAITLAPQGNPGTPTFVQAVGSTLNDNNGITGNNFQFNMPNVTQAGNCLILEIEYPYSASRTVSITDSAGDTWPAASIVAGTTSTGNMNVALYALPNASAGLHTLTIAFDASIKPFRYTLSEFYNVASASPVDGTHSAASVSGSSANAGSFTPTTNNNSLGGHLIYQAAISNDTVGTLLANQASAITATNSAQLIHADNNCTIPSASAYFVQAANGAVNPGFAFTQSTPTNFVVAALALLANAAGSAPPAGIYIKRILHVSVVNPQIGNNAVLFPCDGNLRVATMAAGDNLNLVNSVKDTDNSTGYTDRTNAAGESRIFESANTSADNANVITLNLGSPDPQFSLHLLDIAGADTAPFMNKSGFNGAAPSSGTVFNDFPDHTPNASVNGLTIVQTGMGTAGPQFGYASGAPSGAIFDNVYYTGDTDADRMDNADPFGHAYFSSNTAQTWNWLLGAAGHSSTAFATAVSYKAASGNINVNLTGVAGIGVAGSIIANPAGLLVGVAGTGSAGSLTPSAATGGLAQAAGTGTAGAFTPSVSITLGSVSGTGTAGSIGSLDVPGLVGVAGVGVAQGITPEVDAFLAGASGTGIAGTFSFGGSGSGNLTGATGTGVAGSLTPSISVTLGGATGTGVAGTFTPSVAATLAAAAGTGVAGTFTTTASGSAALAQASGTGIAQGIIASVSGFFAGGAGTGVAGSLAAQVAVNFSGVIGTGIAGGVSGQVTGGTTNVGIAGVAGIGIAGIITADNGVVQAVGGGNGGSRPVREKKKKQPVEFKPVPRKGTFPKGYLPEEAPAKARSPAPAAVEHVRYELPETPLAPLPELLPQLRSPPSIEDLSAFGARVGEPESELEQTGPEPEVEQDQNQDPEPQPEAQTEAAAPAPEPPGLDIDALIEAALQEAAQAKAEQEKQAELQEKIAAEVARQMAAAVAQLKPRIEADLLAKLESDAKARAKAEAARIAKAEDDARRQAEEIARGEAEARAEAEANEKEAERMLEAHIEQENKIRETVSAMIADIIADIQHDLT